MTSLDSLKNLVLAPYILKATALIGVQRQVGGNQLEGTSSDIVFQPLAYCLITNSSPTAYC